MSPEEQLAERVRAIDAAIGAGCASADIAAREERRNGRVCALELKLDAPVAAYRTFLGQLLRRHGIEELRRPRQHQDSVHAIAGAVFVREVLSVQLNRMVDAMDEFMAACVARGLDGVLPFDVSTAPSADSAAAAAGSDARAATRRARSAGRRSASPSPKERG